MFPGHRSKTFSHPKIGAVRINRDVLAVPDDGQQVVFMTADPGTPSARALRHLAPATARVLTGGSRAWPLVIGRLI